jgi:hypothetical protein
MRMEATAGHSKERKVVQNASSKVQLVVQRMLLPLLDAGVGTHVVFDAEDDQAETKLLDHMRATRPELLADEGAFAAHMCRVLKRYRLRGCELLPGLG